MISEHNLMLPEGWIHVEHKHLRRFKRHQCPSTKQLLRLSTPTLGTPLTALVFHENRQKPEPHLILDWDSLSGARILGLG